MRGAVGAPIVVEGRIWCAIVASWDREGSPPPDTEERMARFAELLETAIANADSRDQLTVSRVRPLTAVDEARRHVVRDLHDGAQQRLVHTIVTLKLLNGRSRTGTGEAQSLFEEALAQARQANAALRELAHGILPSVLTRGGLRAAVDSIVSRLDLAVELDLPEGPVPGRDRGKRVLRRRRGAHQRDQAFGGHTRGATRRVAPRGA